MPVASLLMSSMSSGGGQQGGVAQAAGNVSGGLLSGVVGYFQRRKAKKELAKLSRPQYDIPQEILKNQKLAEQQAAEGMPSQQYSNAMRNIQKTQNNLLAGAMDRRSALMALPKIQQATLDATSNLDAQDAGIAVQNKRNLINVGNTTAQYRDKAFDVNKMQPYNRDYNYYMQLLGQGNQNLLGGADRLLGGASQLVFGSQGSGGGSGGSAGGTTMRGSTGRQGAPSYYNGYGAESDYSGFENGF